MAKSKNKDEASSSKSPKSNLKNIEKNVQSVKDVNSEDSVDVTEDVNSEDSVDVTEDVNSEGSVDVTENIKSEENVESNNEKVVLKSHAESEEEIIHEAQDLTEIKDEKKIEIKDFNWNEFEEGKSRYSDSEFRKLESMYDETLSALDDTKVIEGEIVSKSDRDFIIDIGAKSEGVISVNEFRYNPDLTIGDKVEVLIDQKENKTGQLVLSHRKARALQAWDNILDAHDKQTIVSGYVKCRTKGGMIVEVFGLESFLPGSQIDVKPIRDYDVYVGKNMDFKVVKINHEFKNIVVSHKALIEEDIEQQKKDIISKLDKGQVLEGVVKNITSYGVFVDLGGVDGLIHITDLSWSRIQHPNEVVELDQEIKVVTLDFDEDKTRIQLGLKQLTEHPWESLDPNIKVGDKVKANVVVLADYGAFVEIIPGVEALIHVSEMSWSTHLRSAQDFLKLGQEVEAQVLTLDRDERKMSLGIKQLYPDPWVEIDKKYPIDSKHNGLVKNFTNFGIFIELEEGVDGLIHISDLSWTQKVKHPADFTKVGDNLDVIVLEVDIENRRLSLGHKQLQENFLSL